MLDAVKLQVIEKFFQQDQFKQDDKSDALSGPPFHHSIVIKSTVDRFRASCVQICYSRQSAYSPEPCLTKFILFKVTGPAPGSNLATNLCC
ncbi:hypothetical protein L596_017562 [Steinernema carpocapsae]|uniref:Uncharacterized protein n=1 Tax=Steinernema carpocapsae TaxID=34508 RepID=A0A4U5N2S6_STECR|nr:hypothetical protein L596_017562 [Steinernema carpocapsae]